ncbi:MAG: hypothetical protein ACJ8FY_29160 [Gemmataceae bacterium]
MAAYELNCRTCNRITLHSSPGIYVNEEGQKCRNWVCDNCGTSTVHRGEEDAEHADARDYSEDRQQ